MSSIGNNSDATYKSLSHYFTTSTRNDSKPIFTSTTIMNPYYKSPQEMPQNLNDLLYNEEERKQIVNYLVSDWEKLSVNHHQQQQINIDIIKRARTGP